MLPLESKRVKILETEELFFSYEKGDYVLEGINLGIFQSRVYGIFGPNGSGKSTLVKLLAGILKPYKGSIKLNDIEIDRWKKRDIAQKIGYLPQENPLTSEISVYYFLLISRYSYLSGFFKEFNKKDFKLVDEIVKKFDLYSIKERPFNKLSGGERRKVLLASLFVVSPEVFLLDEPDSFLDPANKREIEEILNLLRKENKTLIFTSHSLELITSLSDEIIGLKDGKIVYQGKNLLEKNSEIFSEIFNIKYQVLKEGKRLFFVYE